MDARCNRFAWILPILVMLACGSTGGGGTAAGGPEAERDDPLATSLGAGAVGDAPTGIPDAVLVAFGVRPPMVTLDTFPRIDGSASTWPLGEILACELLDVPWEWTTAPWNLFVRTVQPVPETRAQENVADGIDDLVRFAGSHPACLNLVDGAKDLVLMARAPTEEERAYARSKGVSLVTRTLGLDALVFRVNDSNPVQGLTTAQVRRIYRGDITNWKEVGGPDRPIHPYVRPLASDARELMQALVMGEGNLPAWPSDQKRTVGGFIDAVQRDPDALGYSTYTWIAHQYRATGGTRVIPVDGVDPTVRSLAARVYPFVAPVRVVTRGDLDPFGLVAQLRDWLQTPGGQRIVAKSGYAPASLEP